MIILSLDPSSTITGYAIMDTHDAAGVELPQPRLIESGRLRKPGTHNSDDRIDAMIDDLADLLDEQEPDVVLLETTSGKTSKRHKGGGAGLAIYGQAVGEFRRAIIDRATFLGIWDTPPFDLHCIKENDWTRGTSKQSRQDAIWRYYDNYDRDQDSGQDISDAIYLAMWWWQRQQLEAMSK